MKKIINILAMAMIVGSTFISNVDGESLFAIDVANAQSYGQNGDVDNDTTSANTCYSFSYNMRKGSRDSNTNNEVTKLQEALIQLGHLSQDPSGYFGGATYSAVKNFQSAKGLLSSGYVGSYTRAALQTATCNGNNNPSPTPNPNPIPMPTPIYDINLTPATLPSVVYDKDNGNNYLLGFNFINNNTISSYHNPVLNNNNVSIVNTNVPAISVKVSCYLSTGAIYNYNTTYCGNGTDGVFVSTSSYNLTDNTYYYFTIRINQNGTYTDKQYSFTYKKAISNVCAYGYNNTYGWCDTNNNNNTCTAGYIGGVYGCYYNVTCNSSYDYARGYYVNNCNYINGYNVNGYNTNGYNNSNYYNGTNILY